MPPDTRAVLLAAASSLAAPAVAQQSAYASKWRYLLREDLLLIVATKARAVVPL